MSVLFSAITIWVIASIPISLIAGRILAIRDSCPQPETIELITSNGDIINIY